jgi:hypothetical protein
VCFVVYTAIVSQCCASSYSIRDALQRNFETLKQRTHQEASLAHSQWNDTAIKLSTGDSTVVVFSCLKSAMVLLLVITTPQTCLINSMTRKARRYTYFQYTACGGTQELRRKSWSLCTYLIRARRFITSKVICFGIRGLPQQIVFCVHFRNSRNPLGLVIGCCKDIRLIC